MEAAADEYIARCVASRDDLASLSDHDTVEVALARAAKRETFRRPLAEQPPWRALTTGLARRHGDASRTRGASGGS